MLLLGDALARRSAWPQGYLETTATLYQGSWAAPASAQASRVAYLAANGRTVAYKGNEDCLPALKDGDVLPRQSLLGFNALSIDQLDLVPEHIAPCREALATVSPRSS